MVKQWKKSLTGDDVQAEAEDALEKDISQMSPAANSVADNLDGGVAAVDWASKTPKIAEVSPDNTLTIDGSGFLLALMPRESGTNATVGFNSPKLSIDGENVISNVTNEQFDLNDNTLNLFFRFETSIGIFNRSGSATEVLVVYVLD